MIAKRITLLCLAVCGIAALMVILPTQGGLSAQGKSLAQDAPTETPTETPTVAPTPDAQIIVDLSSGKQAILLRTVTYGDIYILIGLIAIILILIFGFIYYYTSKHAP